MPHAPSEQTELMPVKNKIAYEKQLSLYLKKINAKQLCNTLQLWIEKLSPAKHMLVSAYVLGLGLSYCYEKYTLNSVVTIQ
jgi:hypothetical protein